MTEPHVVILGGGPAGCGAAYQLRRTGKARVTLLERNLWTGGNAGSFELAGQHLDFGSHRLHYSCDKNILQDIQGMLGADLAHRERHGRIRLRGKWLQFPLKLTDLLLRLDPGFAFGILANMLSRTVSGRAEEGDTFASVLNAKLGKTICENFYYPYARKIWGYEPEELSGIQAQKRVSAQSISRILRRLLKPPGDGKFYYPRKGYGQITDAYAAESKKLGAEYLMAWTVSKLSKPEDKSEKFRVHIENEEGQSRTIDADHVWSTIPVTALCRMISPGPPAEVVSACEKISYRSMILVYLTMPVDHFTTTDAHYFPEEHVRMTRLSEPKNYFGNHLPKGMTTLCAELPCQRNDAIWNMSDHELGSLILEDLRVTGLPAHQPIKVFSRRLFQAYPIYTTGYEHALSCADSWVGGIPGLLVFGRQGLFAHDNTHHALYMAYAATNCLEESGKFNQDRWAAYRRIFATHVVED